MGAMLAVAQGSDRPAAARRAGIRRRPDDGPRLALVGKGVTFDSGGLSIKPTDGMLTMKCDMAGAATVLGAMIAVARLKLPVNVTGYMGLVENMISGNSYKLGDVLTARSGTTIEVNNTDAEGRLVLADVLQYAVDEGADRLIDLATLTGACVVALGEDVAGVFTNDQPWCDDVLAAAKRAGEDVWQLPMFDHFAELLKSDVADVKNTGGRAGGADHGGQVPGKVRRQEALGAPRHRRPGLRLRPRSRTAKGAEPAAWSGRWSRSRRVSANKLQASPPI